MDGDERLTALKKACAEMILNTSKEAAARIMASERKTLRLQQEFNATKETALQTMLRLKQRMELEAHKARITYSRQQEKIDKLTAQLREAEDVISESGTINMGQQRKIEELEAQLQEAEDIVSDLREELRAERERNDKLQYMDEHHVASQEQTSDGKRLNTCQSIPSSPRAQLEAFTNLDVNSGLNQISELYEGCSEKDYCMGNSTNIDQSNISATSAENQLKTSESIIFPPQEPVPESYIASDLKNSDSGQRNEAHKCSSEKDVVWGNSNVSKPDVPSVVPKNKEAGPYRNRRTQRIRAFEERLNAGELSFSDTNDEMSARNGEGRSVRKARTRMTEKKGVQADIACYEAKKVKSKRSTSRHRRKRTALKTIMLHSHMSSIGAQSDAEDLSKAAPEGREDKGTPSSCTNVTESEANFVKAVSDETTGNKNEEPADKLLLTGQECKSTDDSGGWVCRMDVKEVEVPLVNAQEKTAGTSTGLVDRPSTERFFFKYTFQRKRKRGAMSSSDGNTSVDKSVLKETAAEIQNHLVETEKDSSRIDQTSQNRRQLVRQLLTTKSPTSRRFWQ